MAEDKYKTPKPMQDVYDRYTGSRHKHNQRMRDAAGDPEKVREAVQDEIKDRRLKGKEFFDKITSYIDSGVQTVAQTAATDDPDSYLDDIARGALGTAQFVGNVASTPGISHTLRLLDSPFWAARQAAGGVLEHGFGVDPRYGHAAVGVGELFVGGKALTGVAQKATKGVKKIQALSKAEDIMNFRRKQELGLQMIDRIDNGPSYKAPEPMWGPPNPQRTRNLSFLNDYNQTRLTVEQIAEDVVKVESKYRGAALQNPGGTITGNPVKSDITGRISGSPAVTQLGDNISPIRYTPKDFVMDDPNSIAGFIRGVNTKAKAAFDFQNHHIASLAEYKRAVKNLSAGERQLGIAYLVEKGIMTGNNPLNRANIPIPVHQGVSNWIAKNIRKYLKDKYPNLESLPLQERWKIFDELAELTRKSEEEMFKLVQQYNASIQGAPGNPGPELIAELFKDSELKNLKWFKQGMKRGDFDFESAGMGASGLEARTKIPKRPLPTKTEEMFKTPKSHLPGGG